MSKRVLVLIVLMTVLLVSCGNDLANPPLVYLVADGQLVDGFQSSYCWDQGIGGEICVDTVAPYFDEVTRLPVNAPIRFQFDTPLPNIVTISINEELFGETILSEKVSPSDFIDWSPTVAPGEYILKVDAGWRQGVVTYWFKVVLE